MRVLLVDDDPIIRKLLQLFLTRRGIDFHVAENGEQAVKAWERESFDAILMDIQMPVMNGYEATAAIRKREGETGRHVPIIALTAWASADERGKCVEAGIDDFMTKPVDFEALTALLQRLVEGKPWRLSDKRS